MPHEISSPRYPQSNGHAEAAVKSVKQLVMKTAPSGTLIEEFDRGLVEFRNTPRQDGRSLAQVLFGRPLRSCAPDHGTSFAKEWQERIEKCDRRATARAEAVRERYDSQACPFQPFHLSAHVRVQDPVTKRWKKVAVVIGVGKSRDYLVRTPSGRILWRNRRYLRAVSDPADMDDDTRPKAEKTDDTGHTNARCRRRRENDGPRCRSERIASRS